VVGFQAASEKVNDCVKGHVDGRNMVVCVLKGDIGRQALDTMYARGMEHRYPGTKLCSRMGAR
jgi:hypothetical protein